MKRFLFSILIISSLSTPLRATEGMWIPLLLERFNIREMQDMGLKLTSEDIYSINHSSLKDAILQFGGGCTAEIVSPQGLILTNLHCGLGSIQRLSSPDHDYLTDGFWAKSCAEEMPCQGLTATLLVRMEDVTSKVLANVTADMPEFRRAQVIKDNSVAIEKEAAREKGCEAKVRSFFYGNQYYLMVTRVFRDIRFVGAPPAGIGQFGGDTDNWMWPRHGADFSIFRIYVNKDNEPALYSADNIPYKPVNFLPISLDGYKNGDFTFVFGYPAITREYLTSFGVNRIACEENPLRIAIRTSRLEIIDKAMNESKLARIQYTAKHQSIANGWKKMEGETKGITNLKAMERKRLEEVKFQNYADSLNNAGNPSYYKLLPAFRKVYGESLPVAMANVWLVEAGMGIECVRFSDGLSELIKKSLDKSAKPEEIDKLAASMRQYAQTFYKDYQPSIDRRIFEEMSSQMIDNMDPKYLPEGMKTMKKNFFGRSILPDSSKLLKLLKGWKRKDVPKLEKDPLYLLSESIYKRYNSDVAPVIRHYNLKIDSLQRLYMAAIFEMRKARIWPDANSTLRIAYGKVGGFSPRDAVTYNYFTTPNGILQKENPEIYDYTIKPEFKKLLVSGDYGRYADADGSLHVAFTAGNHTTGGNSGSPVLDAGGRLIGINFDRNWEGTMSDLMYDPNLCRNISLDIRYCLFIIDKYAGDTRLIDEMKISKVQ